MAESVSKIRVFLASPGDVQEERDCLTRIVDLLNRGVAAEKRLVLELVRWETHAWPSAGNDVQEIISRQLGVPEIFIGIMWKRLGTPTPRAESGTVEEFELALEAWRSNRVAEIMFYFKRDPFFPSSEEDLAQMSKVLRFRERLKITGLLFQDYLGIEAFERQAYDHLTQVLRTFKAHQQDRASIAGVWEGGGTDVYTEDGSPKLDMNITVDIKPGSDPVIGTAELSSLSNPPTKAELVLTGNYYNDEYIQFLYQNRDRTLRQLGVAVVQLSPLGNRLRAHYAGFSPLRNTFVAGKLIVERRK